MPAAIEAALSRAAFERALLDAVDAWPCEETRFYQLAMRGRCPGPMLVRYARSTYLSAKLFSSSLAQMIELAPDSEARLILLENLMSEEGIHLSPDRGLVVRSEQRHVALALRFLRAVAGDGADPESNALHATGQGRAMLAEGRWLEAVANLLVGQELKFGTASVLLLNALRQCGLQERDLAFFAVHADLDCEHGREALDLVIDRARTRVDQERCIRAAHDGARQWFEMHGGRTARAAA